VLISTPEHAHSRILKMVVEADKYAYCEKPMGNVLEEVKAARDAVLARNRIVAHQLRVEQVSQETLPECPAGS